MSDDNGGGTGWRKDEFGWWEQTSPAAGSSLGPVPGSAVKLPDAILAPTSAPYIDAPGTFVFNARDPENGKWYFWGQCDTETEMREKLATLKAAHPTMAVSVHQIVKIRVPVAGDFPQHWYEPPDEARLSVYWRRWQNTGDEERRNG